MDIKNDIVLSKQMTLKIVETVKINNNDIGKYKINITNVKNTKANAIDYYVYLKLNISEEKLDKEKLIAYIQNAIDENPSQSDIYIDSIENFIKETEPNTQEISGSSQSDGGSNNKQRLEFFNTNAKGEINVKDNGSNVENAKRSMEAAMSCVEGNENLFNRMRNFFPNLGNAYSDIKDNLYEIGTKFAQKTGWYSLYDFVDFYKETITKIYDEIKSQVQDLAYSFATSLPDEWKNIDGVDADEFEQLNAEYSERLQSLKDSFLSGKIGINEWYKGLEKLQEEFSATVTFDGMLKLMESCGETEGVSIQSSTSSDSTMKDKIYKSLGGTISQGAFDSKWNTEEGRKELAELLVKTSVLSTFSNYFNTDLGSGETGDNVSSNTVANLQNWYYSTEEGKKALLSSFRDMDESNDDYNAIANTNYIKYCLSTNINWLLSDLTGIAATIAKINSNENFYVLKEISESESSSYFSCDVEKKDGKYYVRDYTSLGQQLLYYMDCHYAEDDWNADHKFVTAFSNQGYIDSIQRGYKNTWIQSRINRRVGDLKSFDIVYNVDKEYDMAYDSALYDFEVLNGNIIDEDRKKQLEAEGELSFSDLVKYINLVGGSIIDVNDKEFLENNRDKIVELLGENPLWNFKITGDSLGTAYSIYHDQNFVNQHMGEIILGANVAITLGELVIGVAQHIEQFNDGVNMFMNGDIVSTIESNSTRTYGGGIYFDAKSAWNDYAEIRDSNEKLIEECWRLYGGKNGERYSKDFAEFSDSEWEKLFKSAMPVYTMVGGEQVPVDSTFKISVMGKEIIFNRKYKSTIEQAKEQAFEITKESNWGLIDSSSSTQYMAGLKLGIRQGGDFTYFDKKLSDDVKELADKQFKTMLSVEPSVVRNYAEEHIYNSDLYKNFEDLSFVKHDNILGVTANQIGNMAIPVLLGTIPFIGKPLSNASLFISAFGGAAEEAITSGAGYNQALKYATFSAATEILIEHLFSGIGGYGDGWFDKLLQMPFDKLYNHFGLSNNFFKILKELITGGIGEATEEVLTDFVTPLWQSISYMNDKSWHEIVKENVSIESLTQTAVVSFLSSLVFKGIELRQENETKTDNYSQKFEKLRNLVEKFGIKIDPTIFESQGRKVLEKYLFGTIENAEIENGGLLEQLIKNASNEIIKTNPEYVKELGKLQEQLKLFGEQNVTIGEGKNSISINGIELLKLEELIDFDGKYTIEDGKIKFESEEAKKNFYDSILEAAKNKTDNQNSSLHYLISEFEKAKDNVVTENDNKFTKLIKNIKNSGFSNLMKSAIEIIAEFNNISDTSETVSFEHNGEIIKIPKAIVSQITTSLSIENGKIQFKKGMDSGKFISAIYEHASKACERKIDKNKYDINKATDKKLINNAIKILKSDLLQERPYVAIKNSEKIPEQNLTKYDVEIIYDGKSRNVSFYIENSTDASAYRHVDKINELISDVALYSGNKSNIYLGQLVYNSKTKSMDSISNNANNLFVQSLEYESKKNGMDVNTLKHIIDTLTGFKGITKESETVTIQKDGENIVIAKALLEQITSKYKIIDGKVKFAKDMSVEKFISMVCDNAIKMNEQFIYEMQNTKIKNSTYVDTNGMDLLELEVETIINGETKTVNVYVDGNTDLSAFKDSSKISEILYELLSENKNSNNVYLGQIIYDEKTGKISVIENMANQLYVDSINAMSESGKPTEVSTHEEVSPDSEIKKGESYEFDVEEVREEEKPTEVSPDSEIKKGESYEFDVEEVKEEGKPTESSTETVIKEDNTGSRSESGVINATQAAGIGATTVATSEYVSSTSNEESKTANQNKAENTERTVKNDDKTHVEMEDFNIINITQAKSQITTYMENIRTRFEEYIKIHKNDENFIHRFEQFKQDIIVEVNETLGNITQEINNGYNAEIYSITEKINSLNENDSRLNDLISQRDKLIEKQQQEISEIKEFTSEKLQKVISELDVNATIVAENQILTERLGSLELPKDFVSTLTVEQKEFLKQVSTEEGLISYLENNPLTKVDILESSELSHTDNKYVNKLIELISENQGTTKQIYNAMDVVRNNSAPILLESTYKGDTHTLSVAEVLNFMETAKVDSKYTYSDYVNATTSLMNDLASQGAHIKISEKAFSIFNRYNSLMTGDRVVININDVMANPNIKPITLPKTINDIDSNIIYRYLTNPELLNGLMKGMPADVNSSQLISAIKTMSMMREQLNIKIDKKTLRIVETLYKNNANNFFGQYIESKMSKAYFEYKEILSKCNGDHTLAISEFEKLGYSTEDVVKTLLSITSCNTFDYNYSRDLYDCAYNYLISKGYEGKIAAMHLDVVYKSLLDLRGYDTLVTHDGIRIHVQKGLYWNNQAYTPQYIQSELENIRRNMYKTNIPVDVYVYDTFNPGDKYWSVEFKDKDFRSAATSGNGNIYIYTTSYTTGTVLSHEYGHLIDFQIMKDRGSTGRFSETQEYLDAMKKDNKAPSGYATMNSVEDFAESIAHMREDPAKFKKEFPNRYEVISKYTSAEFQINNAFESMIEKFGPQESFDRLREYVNTGNIDVFTEMDSVKETMSSVDKNAIIKYMNENCGTEFQIDSAFGAMMEKFGPHESFDKLCEYINTGNLDIFIEMDSVRKTMSSVDKNAIIKYLNENFGEEIVKERIENYSNVDTEGHNYSQSSDINPGASSVEMNPTSSNTTNIENTVNSDATTNTDATSYGSTAEISNPSETKTNTTVTAEDLEFIDVGKDVEASMSSVQDVQSNVDSVVSNTVTIDGIEIEIDTLKQLQTLSNLENALKTGEYAGVRIEKALVELSKIDGVTLEPKLQELVKVCENLSENEVIYNIEDVINKNSDPAIIKSTYEGDIHTLSVAEVKEFMETGKMNPKYTYSDYMKATNSLMNDLTVRFDIDEKVFSQIESYNSIYEYLTGKQFNVSEYADVIDNFKFYYDFVTKNNLTLESNFMEKLEFINGLEKGKTIANLSDYLSGRNSSPIVIDSVINVMGRQVSILDVIDILDMKSNNHKLYMRGENLLNGSKINQFEFNRAIRALNKDSNFQIYYKERIEKFNQYCLDVYPTKAGRIYVDSPIKFGKWETSIIDNVLNDPYAIYKYSLEERNQIVSAINEYMQFLKSNNLDTTWAQNSIDFINKELNHVTSKVAYESKLLKFFNKFLGDFGANQGKVFELLTGTKTSDVVEILCKDQSGSKSFMQKLNDAKFTEEQFKQELLRINKENSTFVIENIDMLNTLIEQVKTNYPGMTTKSALQFLYLMEASEGSNGICNYAAMVNLIFDKYQNHPALFEKDFGYSMYIELNGETQLNTTRLLVDMYSIINKGILVTGENGNYSINLNNEGYLNLSDGGRINTENLDIFLKGKNIKMHIEKNFAFDSFDKTNLMHCDEVLTNIHDALARGEHIHVSAGGFNLYDVNGNLTNSNVGGHIMSVVGITEDGRLIVDSWGKKLYLNLSEQMSSIGETFNNNGQTIPKWIRITSYDISMNEQTNVSTNLSTETVTVDSNVETNTDATSYGSTVEIANSSETNTTVTVEDFGSNTGNLVSDTVNIDGIEIKVDTLKELLEQSNLENALKTGEYAGVRIEKALVELSKIDGVTLDSKLQKLVDVSLKLSDNHVIFNIEKVYHDGATEFVLPQEFLNELTAEEKDLLSRETKFITQISDSKLDEKGLIRGVNDQLFRDILSEITTQIKGDSKEFFDKIRNDIQRLYDEINDKDKKKNFNFIEHYYKEIRKQYPIFRENQHNRFENTVNKIREDIDTKTKILRKYSEYINKEGKDLRGYSLAKKKQKPYKKNINSSINGLLYQKNIILEHVSETEFVRAILSPKYEYIKKYASLLKNKETVIMLYEMFQRNYGSHDAAYMLYDIQNEIILKEQKTIVEVKLDGDRKVSVKSLFNPDVFDLEKLGKLITQLDKIYSWPVKELFISDAFCPSNFIAQMQLKTRKTFIANHSLNLNSKTSHIWDGNYTEERIIYKFAEAMVREIAITKPEMIEIWEGVISRDNSFVSEHAKNDLLIDMTESIAAAIMDPGSLDENGYHPGIFGQQFPERNKLILEGYGRDKVKLIDISRLNGLPTKLYDVNKKINSVSDNSKVVLKDTKNVSNSLILDDSDISYEMKHLLYEGKLIIRDGQPIIYGAHNKQHFDDLVRANPNLRTIYIPHPSIPGIYNVEYSLTDANGNIIRRADFPKTVYDPTIISDEKILKLRDEALRNGTFVDNRSKIGMATNGLLFQAYYVDGRLDSGFPFATSEMAGIEKFMSQFKLPVTINGRLQYIDVSTYGTNTKIVISQYGPKLIKYVESLIKENGYTYKAGDIICLDELRYDSTTDSIINVTTTSGNLNIINDTFEVYDGSELKNTLDLRQLIGNNTDLLNSYSSISEEQRSKLLDKLVEYITYVKQSGVDVDINPNVEKFYNAYMSAKQNNLHIFNVEKIIRNGSDMIAISEEIYNKNKGDMPFNVLIEIIKNSVESLDEFEKFITNLYLDNEKYRIRINDVINSIDSSIQTNENFKVIYNVISKLNEHTIADNTVCLANVYDMIYKNAEPIFLPNYIDGEFRNGNQAIRTNILLDIISGKNEFTSLYNANIIENCRVLYNYLQSNNITLSEDIMQKLEFINNLNENQIVLNINEYFEGKPPIVTTEFIYLQNVKISSLEILEILKMDSDEYIKLLRDGSCKFQNINIDNLFPSIQSLFSQSQTLREQYNENFVKLQDLDNNCYILMHTLTIMPETFNGYDTSLIDYILNNPNIIDKYSVSEKQNLVKVIKEFVEYLKNNNYDIEYYDYEKALEFLSKDVPKIDSRIAIKTKLYEIFDSIGKVFGTDQGAVREAIKNSKIDVLIQFVHGKYIKATEFMQTLNEMNISEDKFRRILEISSRGFIFTNGDVKMSELANIVMKNYPGMTSKDALQFLHLMEASEGSDGICNYASMVNLIFDKYKDYPKLFEEHFGYPMYIVVNGKQCLNTTTLLVDMFSIINDGVLIKEENGRYIIEVDNKKYRNLTANDGTIEMKNFQIFLDKLAKKGIDFNINEVFKYNSDDTNNRMHYEEVITNIHDALARGEHVHLSSGGFNLYYPNGMVAAKNVGSHIMSVVGITEDGNLIVDSWGRKLVFDLREEMASLGMRYKGSDGKLYSKFVQIVSYDISMDGSSNINNQSQTIDNSHIDTTNSLEVFDIPRPKANSSLDGAPYRNTLDESNNSSRVERDTTNPIELDSSVVSNTEATSYDYTIEISKPSKTNTTVTEEDLVFIDGVKDISAPKASAQDAQSNADSAATSTVIIDGKEIEVEKLKELLISSNLEKALKNGVYQGVRVEKALVELSKLDGVTLDSKLQELVKISEIIKEDEIIFNIEDVYSNGILPNIMNIDVYNEFIRSNPNSNISIDDLYKIINSNSVIYRLISNDTIIKNVSNDSIKESLEYLVSISNRYNYENKVIREAQYLLDLMNDNYTTEELYDAFAIAHTEFNTPDVYYECYDYLKTMDVDSAIKLLESKGYTTLDITDAFLNLAIRMDSQELSKRYYYKAFDYLVENGMNEKEAATIIRDKYRTLINRRGTRVVTTTPNGVKIRIVNNISSNNKLFTIEKIESMIKQAEKYYSKTGLKEIVIFDSFAPHNIYSEKVQYEDYVKTHNNRRFVAAASATKSSIILWEDFDKLDSIVHEYGHTIDKHIQSVNNLSTVFSSSSAWLEAIQKDTAITTKRVSEYAYASKGEDFAEFLKYFNRNPLDVARKYPNRYKAASKYLNLDIDSNIIERYLDSKKFFIAGIEDLSNLLTEDGSMLEFIKQYAFENLKGDNSIAKTVISELDAIYESRIEIIEDYGLYSLFIDMSEQERIGSHEFIKIMKDYLDGKDISSKFKDSRNFEIIELLEKEEIQEWYEEELNEMTAETEKIPVSDEDFEKMMNSLFSGSESNSSSDTSIIKDEESTYNDSLIEDADVDMAFPKKSIFSKKIETVSVSDIPRVFRNMNTADIISILEGKTILKNDENFINNKKSIIRFVKYLSENNIKLSLNERANTIIENLRNGDFRLNILNFSDVLNGDAPIYGPSSINLDGIKISSDDVMVYLENKKNEISSIITSDTPNEDARDLLNAIDELGSKNDIIYDKYRKSIKMIERIERSYVYRSYDSYYLLPKSFNGIETSRILNSDLISLVGYINSLSNADKKSYRVALDEFGKFIYKSKIELSKQDLARLNKLYDVINTKKFSTDTIVKSRVYDIFEMSYRNNGEFGSNQGKVREVIKELGITNFIQSLFSDNIETSKFLQTLSEVNISEREFVNALNGKSRNFVMTNILKNGDINFKLFNSLIEQVKINYPNMSTFEAIRFLYLIESREVDGPGICNNPIFVNMIFDRYIGREIEFERDFGYPMYIKANNGKKVLNEARLLVDLFDTLNEGVLVENVNGKYVIQTTNESYVRAYDLNGLRYDAITKFIQKKGINLNVSKTYFFNSNEEIMHYDYLMKQIKDELDKGNYVILGAKGFDLDVENFEFREDCAGHAMTIVGIDTTGELIVDTWGMKGRVDLRKELSRVNELFKNSDGKMNERIFTISSYKIS